MFFSVFDVSFCFYVFFWFLYLFMCFLTCFILFLYLFMWFVWFFNRLCVIVYLVFDMFSSSWFVLDCFWRWFCNCYIVFVMCYFWFLLWSCHFCSNDFCHVFKLLPFIWIYFNKNACVWNEVHLTSLFFDIWHATYMHWNALACKFKWSKH